MKRLLASTAVLALSAGAAFAADLPSSKDPILPLPLPTPTWTGFYAGLNAGATWSNTPSLNFTSAPDYILPITLPGMTASNFNYALTHTMAHTAHVATGNPLNFIGGGQVGYNWDFLGKGLFSVEADFQGLAGAGASGAYSSYFTVPNNNNNAGRSAMVLGNYKLDYLGTARGRLGYFLAPSLLVYGTAGFAYGGVTVGGSTYSVNYADHTDIRNDFHLSGIQNFGSRTRSGVAFGWTAGAGAEWMFWNNWSAKVEYLYYDLGTASLNYDAMMRVRFPAGSSGQIFYSNRSFAQVRFNGNVVRAGVNYHFNWSAAAPVVAKY
jgi:outer membrane immunogenic protein